MDEIHEFISKQTMDLLVENYGGRQLRVPSKPEGQAWERLVERIGEDHAQIVVKRFPGESFAIPKATNKGQEETIRNLRQAGMSVSEIAGLGFIRPYSERHIYRICEPGNPAS